MYSRYSILLFLILLPFLTFSQKKKVKDFTWYSNAREVYGTRNISDSLYVIFEFSTKEDPHYLFLTNEIDYSEKIIEIEEYGLYLDELKNRYIFVYNFGNYNDLISQKKFRLMVEVFDSKERKIRDFHILKSSLIDLKDLFEN